MLILVVFDFYYMHRVQGVHSEGDTKCHVRLFL